MQKLQSFINGQYIESASTETITILNPATNEEIFSVQACTRDEAKQAIQASKAAQKAWAGATTSAERADYIRKMATELKRRKEEFARVITMEQGKLFEDALGEINHAITLAEYHAGWALRMEGEAVKGDALRENMIIFREPMGVVACILPWNFPIAVMMRKLAPALITGNTAVLKPSSETPAATLMMGEVFKAIGLPDGVVNIVPGHGNEVGDELSSNPDVNMITLTGSTASGRAVMQAAAQNITKVSLELGGKAPSIVMNDADVDLAVETIFNGKFFNAGQVCTSVERVYVQEEIADIFVSKMTEKICAMTIGDGLAQPAPQMGPLINSQAVDSVDANVKKAVSQGAKVVVGGKRGNSKGCFYQPTLLVDCNHSMDIMHQEIFGPVMPVMRFDTPEQALALANDSEYGLTSVLYTSDFSTAMLFANNIAFGELFINRQQGEAINGYHAGWKKSGTGGDDGKHGMEEFQQTRTVYLKY